MFLVRIFLFCFLLIQTILPSAFSQSDTLFCYKTNKPISINGILSEWNSFDSISYSGNKKTERGKSDNSAITKFTWDNEKLYIAFKVTDNDLVSNHINNDSNVWDDDCIEVYLSTNPKNKTFIGLSQYEYHFLINLNNTKGTLKGEVDYNLNEESSEGTLNWDADILSDVTISGSLNDSSSIDEGYIVEMAIFWKSLNIIPKNGTTLLIDFCVEDNDYNKTLGYFDYAGLEQLFARPILWTKMILKDFDNKPKELAQVKSTNQLKHLLIFTLIGFFLLAIIILFIIKRVITANKKLELVDNKTTSNYHQEKANKILSIIKKKYTDSDITASNIAHNVNISERHLRRILKDAYDKSFTEILSEYRAKKGADLLLNTSKTITEISFEVGCSSLVQFTRIFKKEFNTTPSNYRKTEC